MRHILTAATIMLLFTACKKDLTIEEDAVNGNIVSSEALSPLPCHSTSFITNYSIKAGQVPPFRFTKTQYSDSRIKTINMLSRANPIHPAFKPQAWELIGTFTYGPNTAYLNGTKQLWEYYKTSTGASARKSILKKNISLRFSFYRDNTGNPLETAEAGTCSSVFNLLENELALRTYIFPHITVGPGSDEPELDYSVNYLNDSILSIYTLDPTQPKDNRKITFKYNPANASVKRNISYQPTQNWISLEYTLLEVMQWLPSEYRPFTERASVSVEFYPYNTNYKVVQSQVYKNHQYDTKGNMLSFTYADNVLQKTTWHCNE